MSLTPTKTELQVSTDMDFIDVVYSGSSTQYRTSESMTDGSVPYGQLLYARVRHTTQEYGTSGWSDFTSFKVFVPADVIGVCCNPSAPFWSWIDEQGNKVDAFDYQDYPTYKNAKMMTFDAERAPVTMTAIPLFYIKTAASGPAGSYAEGKKCWWMSPTAKDGYRPHPAFKRSPDGTISDWCYLGTFISHEEIVNGKVCLGSKIGQTAKHTTHLPEFKTYIANRINTAIGETGYRMIDCWDMGLLRLLAIVAKCSANAQTAWGEGSTSNYPPTGSTQAKLIFKGTVTDPEVWIDDLWRHYWYWLDNLTSTSGQYKLMSPMDSTSTVQYTTTDTTRYTQSKSGWVDDVCDCPMIVGDDVHDLMELFLTKTVTTNSAYSPYGDYAYANTSASIWWRTGGAPGNSSSAGLFITYGNIFDTNSYWDIGCRMAKN